MYASKLLIENINECIINLLILYKFNIDNYLFQYEYFPFTKRNQEMVYKYLQYNNNKEYVFELNFVSNNKHYLQLRENKRYGLNIFKINVYLNEPFINFIKITYYNKKKKFKILNETKTVILK